MRKLVFRCDCGQLIQAPRSAVGKRGICPACGQKVEITADGGTPRGNRRRQSAWTGRTAWWRSGGNGEPSEDAKQRFGQAVDLYNEAKYGEALAVFNSLALEYPGNPDVQRGQNKCLKAMRRPALPNGSSYALPQNADLTDATVRRIILDKMLHGSTETVQLQAAELAARMLNLFDGHIGMPDQPSADSEASRPDVEHTDETDDNAPADPGPTEKTTEAPVSTHHPTGPDAFEEPSMAGLPPEDKDIMDTDDDAATEAER